MTDFTNLALAAPIADALAAEGYSKPTPIQAEAIPLVLAGRDLLGIAQTGTGKTAAFALPILDALAKARKRPSPRHCRVLVLTPTRELAGQVADSFRTYGRFLNPWVQTVFGGVPVGKQVRALAKGTDVLVATPGRLLDLIDQRALSLSEVEVLVLDEADQMLDLGFIHALRRVVTLVPKRRQTLFFSATMPKAIAELAAKFLTHPARVEVKPAATTAERVTQRVTFVGQAEKQALLTVTLRDPAVERAIVFTRTKHGADKVVRKLRGCGIEAAAIHGNKSQAQRTRALAAFKNGDAPILVATDIAARGIDIDDVSHVVNFEIPNVPEQYVHRIGRTARAGKSGLAVSFVAPDERTYLKDIEKLTRQRLQAVPLPDNFRAEVDAVAAAKPLAEPREDRSDRPGGRRGPGGARRNGGRKKPAHSAQPLDQKKPGRSRHRRRGGKPAQSARA